MTTVPSTKITRIELIDHTKKGEGREFVRYYDTPVTVTYDLQDDERTLKIFVATAQANIHSVFGGYT